MVMPSELGHAMYAREVLRFLVGNFRHVAIEMFRDKLFGGLSQSTVLLFCEGYGEHSRRFLIASSTGLNGSDRQVARADIEAVKNGRFRFTHYLISPEIRELYQSLATQPNVHNLGEVADVGIGYVTGANDFFHVSLEEARRWDIPKQYLRPCVLNLRGFKDIEYTLEHWKAKRKQGVKAYLLTLPPLPAKGFPSGLQKYLRQGEESELAVRYKCRIREFWYVVPHIRIADAFLSYMSGEQPLLVSNAANLVAPNTVHILRFDRRFDPLSHAASWRSSLTRLSCELEGHALGGGLFKLEPSEAERVLVVRPSASISRTLVAQLRKHSNVSLEQATETADKSCCVGSWDSPRKTASPCEKGQQNRSLAETQMSVIPVQTLEMALASLCGSARPSRSTHQAGSRPLFQSTCDRRRLPAKLAASVSSFVKQTRQEQQPYSWVLQGLRESFGTICSRRNEVQEHRCDRRDSRNRSGTWHFSKEHWECIPQSDE